MRWILLICIIGFGADYFINQESTVVSSVRSLLSKDVAESKLSVKGLLESATNAADKLAGGSEDDQLLAYAFRNQQSDLQISGSGKVIRTLPDDVEGSRHQKFILELSSGQTLLVAHNIDLAARIDSLDVGDRVDFYGEYEWNSKGGVIHWTHHDPDGLHEDGWLKHDGRTYQ